MNCYCYLIGWTTLNLWYYGCRYAKNADPSDLWVKYFTSSKFVAELRNKHGEPDVVQVRKTFNSQFAARKWEARVCTRLNVRDNPKWINKHNGGGDFLCTEHTEETRKKLSEKGTGRRASDEARKNMSIAQRKLNKKLSDEAKRKISEARKGKPPPTKGRKLTLDQIKAWSPCRVYEFISPSGDVVVVDHLKSFCEQNGLSYEGMKRTANRVHEQHKGWTANPPKEKYVPKGNPKLVKFIKDDVIYEVLGLKKFCEENDLSYKAMCHVRAGTQESHKGFYLCKGEG